MNFLLSRDGQPQGTYPLSSLPEMRRYGGVRDTDEILVDGAAGWVRVKDYVPPHGGGPPPIPMSSAGAGRLPPSPAKGATSAVPSDELLAAVEAGGRFVLFTYCLSILVLTFRRSSEVMFLRRDQDGAVEAIKFSAISGVLGWWGIPWGPIWTIAALITNARGGKDVTREILTGQYGEATANAILSRRQKPAPAGWLMKSFRVALIAVPVLLLASLALPLGVGLATGSSSPRTHSAFNAANEQISVHHDRVAFGNSDQAVAVASEVSRTLKVVREAAFKGGKKDGLSMSGHEFLTYCDLREGQCIVMVHVPELRRFTADAKDSLAHLAWGTTQSALRHQNTGTAGMKVLVGIRGIALYDRVMKGIHVTGAEAKENGLTETLKDGREVLEAAFEQATGTSTRSK